MVDDDVGGTVKHVRTYQVYRGMSPEAVSRLEVRISNALFILWHCYFGLTFNVLR